VPGGGHGLGGADPALISDTENRAVAFIHRHLAGEGRSAEIEPLLRAFTAIDEARAMAEQGDAAGAMKVLADALVLSPWVTVDGSFWNALCWHGSLSGHAAAVLTACDRAVAMSDSYVFFLDSRAVARALTGDLRGAIDDLEAIAADDSGAGSNLWREVRQGWLTALRSGESPFTEELLESLRGR
jgi:hypothetical protein